MEKDNITVNATGNLLVIRHGEAEPISKVKPLIFEGNIFAPGLYVAHRQPPIDATVVIFDTSKQKIIVTYGEFEGQQDVITGKLELFEVITELGINAEKRFSLQQLAGIVKRLRHHFVDKDKCAELVSSLVNFTAKFEEFIQKEDDSRGVKTDNFSSRMVENAIPLSFILCVPIFKGQDKSTFEVNIQFEKRDKGLSLWLESPELYELVLAETEKVFTLERDTFSGYLIIEK